MPGASPGEGRDGGKGLCAIGVDIGGTHLRAARVAADGAILARARLPSGRDPEAVLGNCLRLLANLRTPAVAGVGIGVPGRVDAERGLVLSGGHVDLSRLALARRIGEAAGLPVAIENDAAMALLAEHAVGAARGCGEVAMLTLGTGIGGAILHGGRLLRGRATAGQLGHLVVEPRGLPCLCGRTGCLETTSSGTAFARLCAEASLPAGTRIEDLLDRPDDPRARGVLLAWAGPLRRAIDSLVATLDPRLVLLGGGLGGAAIAALALCPAEPSWYDAPVRAAALGDDAGVVGAAVAAMGATAGASRRAVLVNGVPASGKSGVARALARALGWPLLTLDTLKAPFLDELPPGDRSFNRTLGRASYRAIFDLIAEAPDATGFVVDAWFGFQPVAMLVDGLARAQVGAAVELWCEAPPAEVGRRYAERVARRPPGHPGLDYVAELVDLAGRAGPTDLAPVLRIDTTRPLDLRRTVAWIEDALAYPRRTGA